MQKEVITNTKRKPGRPAYKIKTKEPELCECLFCTKIFDRNDINRSLDEVIANNTQFCSRCFHVEILDKEYDDNI